MKLNQIIIDGLVPELQQQVERSKQRLADAEAKLVEAQRDPEAYLLNTPYTQLNMHCSAGPWSFYPSYAARDALDQMGVTTLGQLVLLDMSKLRGIAGIGDAKAGYVQDFIDRVTEQPIQQTLKIEPIIQVKAEWVEPRK